MQDADDTSAAMDSDAFASAFSDSEPASTGDDQEENGGAEGPARDEQGRFAARQTAGDDEGGSDEGGEDQQQEQPQPAQARGEQEQDRRVPLGEYLTEREKRQAMERELNAIRQQMAEWQRQQQEPEPEPDPYGDPDGYRAWIRSQQASLQEVVATEMRNYRVNMTFADAHEQHGEKFDAAYAALQQAPQDIKDQVMGAVNPGRALMRWHGQQTAMAAIGDDFDGFLSKKQEEWLKDPKVREQVLAMAREEAGGRSSNNITSLPSLGAAPGSSGRTAGADGGNTFEAAFGGPRRR